MERLLLGRPAEVLESVYDLDIDDQGWIRGITSSISPYIDGGQGVLGSVFRMGRTVEMPVLSPVRADDEVPAFIQYLRATEQASGESGIDADRFGRLFAATGMGTLSANRSGTAAFNVFRREFDGSGVVDAAGLIVSHAASRSFVFFTARQRERSEVPVRARDRWIDLQAHIGAVFDLRHRLQNDAFDERDAVWFDTKGRCVEAGPAVQDDIRARLRHAVASREGARAGVASSKRSDLERYWTNVLSGKWAIVDWFDSDGRRFVIALPVSKYGDRLRGLTAREREVFDLLARGLSNKVIGFELDISETAVSSHLNTIYKKLGVGNRAALVQLAQVLR